MEGLIFIAFILLMLGLSFFGLRKRFKDKQLYNKRIPATEKWGKILYFGGRRRDAGRSHLRLSDGRIFSVWGSASPFSFTFKFKQETGGTLSGTYKESFTSPSEITSEITIDDVVYKFNLDKTQKSFDYNGFTYSIPLNPAGNQVTFNYNWQVNNTLLLGNQVKKNREVFATIGRITDNYTEVLFNSSQVSPEELFFTSFMVMSEKLISGT